jgi:hypothetical protein
VSGKPAHVKLERLAIEGPVVNIDQLENKAWVGGLGHMRLPSQTDLEGKKLSQPMDLIIHWKERMVFDGKVAEFDGGVQAVQADGRLHCHTLQVLLEKPVSLSARQDGKAQQPAVLDYVVCASSRNSGISGVRMEKETRLGDKLMDFCRLEGREAVFERLDSELKFKGPGSVYIFQLGTNQNNPLAPPTPDKTAPENKLPETEMKLTRITYFGDLHGVNKVHGNNSTRVVTISGFPIDLVYLPAEDPDVPIDLDNLPPRSFWMRCGRLKASNTKLDNKTAAQEFEASNQVVIKAQEFYAHADIAKYDESKDLLILEGKGTNEAVLWQQPRVGGAWKQVRGTQIWYWRKNGTFKVVGINQINPGP